MKGHEKHFLVIIGSLILWSLAPVEAKPNTPEWLLNQEQGDIGLYTVYVTHDAIKVFSQKGGFCMVTRAPKWDLVCFRPKEKVIFTCPLQEFEARMLVNPFAHGLARHRDKTTGFRTKGKITTLGSGTSNGQRYLEYSADLINRRFTYWGATDIAVDPNCAELLCRLNSVPHIDQIPLYVRKNTLKLNSTYSDAHQSTKNSPFYTDVGSGDLRLGPQVNLVTKSWKKIAMNPSDFQIPPGYKPVGDILDVTYSNDMKDELTTAIDTAGFLTSGNGKKSPPAAHLVKPARLQK